MKLEVLESFVTTDSIRRNRSCSFRGSIQVVLSVTPRITAIDVFLILYDFIGSRATRIIPQMFPSLFLSLPPFTYLFTYLLLLFLMKTLQS